MDLIERQKAINALANTKDLVDVTWTDENDNVIDSIEEKRNIIANWLEEVPSAQPYKEPYIIKINKRTEGDIKRMLQKIVEEPLVLFPTEEYEVIPQIIRCKDCKYAEIADTEDSQDGYTCQFHRGSIWFSGSYCSWAERREDG